MDEHSHATHTGAHIRAHTHTHTHTYTHTYTHTRTYTVTQRDTPPIDFTIAFQNVYGYPLTELFGVMRRGIVSVRTSSIRLFVSKCYREQTIGHRSVNMLVDKVRSYAYFHSKRPCSSVSNSKIRIEYTGKFIRIFSASGDRYGKHCIILLTNRKSHMGNLGIRLSYLHLSMTNSKGHAHCDCKFL